MSRPTKLDPRLLEFCRTEAQKQKLEAVMECGSVRAAAKALDLHDSTIQEAIQKVKKYAEQRGYSPEHDLTKVLPETLKLRGTSTLYHAEKGMMMQWVKTRADEEAQAQAVLEGIKDALRDYTGLAKPVSHLGFAETDCLTAYVMGDAHFGLYTDKDETQIADFDSEIAYRIMQGAVDYLVNAAPASQEALFVNVGDALHIDNRTNKTPQSGHLLDADSRYYRIIKVFVWSMIHAIQRMLEKHEMVTVINAAGNHDQDSTHWIQLSLSLYFQNEDRVNVIIDPSKYHKYVFGKCLIGVTHGDGIKMEALPNVMASLWPQDWGQSNYRHWLTGHIHHQVLKEFNGCKIESFNTLAPSDAWAAAHAYFAAREMHSMVFNKEYGLVARNVCPVGLAHS